MSLEEFTMKRVRRQFTVEFKKNTVSLVVDEWGILSRGTGPNTAKFQYPTFSFYIIFALVLQLIKSDEIKVA